MIEWFLPGIIILGLVTSYEDIKHGKIRNKWIIGSIVYSAVAYAVILVSTPNIRAGYFFELGIMLLIVLIVGFIMYSGNLWTPGDAKLFFAYSILMPLSTYKYGYIQYFPSINILINTFVPLFIYYAAITLLRTSREQKMSSLKKNLEPKRLLQSFTLFFGLSWISTLVGNFLISMSCILLVVYFFDKLDYEILLPAIGLAVLRIIFDRNIIGSLTYIFVFWLMFIVIRYIFIDLGQLSLTKEVDITLLKPGMVAGEAVYLEKGRYKKEELVNYSIIPKSKKKKYIVYPEATGITAEEIKALRKTRLEHLRIKETIPFAPFLFGGALLTLLSQGNSVYYLAKVIEVLL